MKIITLLKLAILSTFLYTKHIVNQLIIGTKQYIEYI